MQVSLFSKERNSNSGKKGGKRWGRLLWSEAIMGTGGQKGRYRSSNCSIPIPEWATICVKRFQPSPRGAHCHLAAPVLAIAWNLEAGKQLWTFFRERGADKAIGKGAQTFTFWWWLQSGMKERQPFQEDVCHPGKWTPWILSFNTKDISLFLPQMLWRKLSNHTR